MKGVLVFGMFAVANHVRSTRDFGEVLHLDRVYCFGGHFVEIKLLARHRR